MSLLEQGIKEVTVLEKFSEQNRVAVPQVKKGAKALGKEAFKTAGQVVGDAATGKNIKQAAK